MGTGTGADSGVVRLPAQRSGPPKTSIEKQTKKRKGRPRGAVNKSTLEIRAFFRKFFESAIYRKNLEKRIKAGEANHMEILGHYYAYGKPKSTMVLETKETSPLVEILKALPKERRLEIYELARRLREATKVPVPVAGKVIEVKALPPTATNGKA